METSFAYEAKEFWRIAQRQIRMSKPFEHWCLDTREVSGLESLQLRPNTGNQHRLPTDEMKKMKFI